MKKQIVLLLLLLLSPVYVFAANQIGSYGFEDWDGSILTTPDYPFGSDAEEWFCIVETCNPTKYASNPSYYDGYADRCHEATTEVITSYESNTGGTWTAHTGSYFMLGNDSSTYALSPSVPGITDGYENQQGRNLGHNWDYGGLGRADWGFEQIDTGEFFVQFWARRNRGNGTLPSGTYQKWLVLSTNASPGSTGMFFHVEGDEPINTTIRIQVDTNNDGAVETVGTAEISGANDGAWHKWSFYVNYNTGGIKWWYDADDVSVDTPDINYSGSMGSATRITSMHIQGNFSAKYPTESTYHALDDIEVWDGMPDDAPPPLPQTSVLEGSFIIGSE